MPRSKKIDDKKKSSDKKAKPTQTKENKKPKESPNKKVKTPPTQTKENKKPAQTKENKKSPDKKVKTLPTQTKENKKTKDEILQPPKVVDIPKEKTVVTPHQRKRSNSMDLFDKYAYDIYTEDEKRQEALGNLVIAFGPTELIKKLDSENMKSPNMSHKFNYDKKWVRDNFKSEKR
jgi:hypothetical protein